MATEVLLPKQGNSVESCIIVEWTKSVGDQVKTGEVLCQVETDKAVVDVESPADGTLLKTFFELDDEVPVHTLIALLGDKGEDVSGYAATTGGASASDKTETKEEPVADASPVPSASPAAAPKPADSTGNGGAVSPRARNLAQGKGLDSTGLTGSGPGGRIIERDVKTALEERQPLTPAAAAQAQGLSVPVYGTGPGGRILLSDLGTGAAPAASPEAAAAALGTAFPGGVNSVSVKGIRKVISRKMHESLVSTAQLTLNSSFDATAVLALRKRFKESPEEKGLTKITLNDMILFAVSRTLKEHPEMNQHFLGDTMELFDNVHLGCAVDTAKGLMVPVIRFADALSLKGISGEAKRLISACLDGKAGPDDLSGGTFTITNLGALGVESFTPVLNPPEVGILGVCALKRTPVEKNGELVMQSRMGLSLTFDHRALDGAPAARFLKDLVDTLENIDLALAG